MFTHENPLLEVSGFVKIDFNSIELREVEKKEMINLLDAKEKADQFFTMNSETLGHSLTVDYPLLK